MVHPLGPNQHAFIPAQGAVLSLLRSREPFFNTADFRVLRADVHNALALLELADGNRRGAIHHAGAALLDAACDGHSYRYKVAQDEAKRLLNLAKQ